MPSDDAWTIQLRLRWTARYITPNGHRRLLGSWVHGSMANALPMAVGAQICHPGRQVVSLSGDGGLAMLLGELLTAKTHDLAVKVVVFNNSSLGMVRVEMLAAGDPPFDTDHDPVDYAAIATAAAFHARRVTDPGQLESAASDVFSHDGPALLDVVTSPDALEVPPHVRPRDRAAQRPQLACPMSARPTHAGRRGLAEVD